MIETMLMLMYLQIEGCRVFLATTPQGNPGAMLQRNMQEPEHIISQRAKYCSIFEEKNRNMEKYGEKLSQLH